MKPDERDDAAALMVLFAVVVIVLALIGAGAYFAFMGQMGGDSGF